MSNQKTGTGSESGSCQIEKTGRGMGKRHTHTRSKIQNSFIFENARDDLKNNVTELERYRSRFCPYNVTDGVLPRITRAMYNAMYNVTDDVRYRSQKKSHFGIHCPPHGSRKFHLWFSSGCRCPPSAMWIPNIIL